MSSNESITLSNGLKVVFVKHKVGSVTCCLRGLAGSNYELENEIGAAHILEHLCTFGSEKYDTYQKLRNIVLAGGGRVTGTTSRDDVAYLTKTLKENYEDGIKYLFEIFYRPILNKENLEKTKEIIEHEIYLNMENPQKHIGRISYKILYPNQRFSTLNTGSIENIKNVDLKHIVNFKSRMYSPSNFVLSICGDLKKEDLFKVVRQYFEKIPYFDTNTSLQHKPNYKRSFLVENRSNLDHLHLKIDYHGFKTDQKEKYGAYLLAKLLKNRLKVLLNQSKYSINPYILDTASFNSNSYGLFGLYTAIKREELVNFLKSFKLAYKSLCGGEILKEEIDFIKNKTKADFEFNLEKTSIRADFYSELFLYNNLTTNHEDEINNYLSCTVGDLKKVASKIFDQEPKITILDKKLDENELSNVLRKVFG